MLIEKINLLDLGRHGLRKATRGTLGVLFSFIVLNKLVSHFSLSPTLPFLGVIVAMMGSLVVNDLKIRDQKITTLLLFVPAVIGTVLSILLSTHPLIQVSGFILITFFAVYLRKYGIRYMGLGMISYMSYFCPLFFHMHKETILWAIAFHAISVLIVYIMRFWLFPERPKKMMHLYLKTFADLETIIFKKIKNGESVRDDMLKLNELVLLIESFLNSTDSKKLSLKPDTLQTSLFEREVKLQMEIYHRNKNFTQFEKSKIRTNKISPILETRDKLHFQTKQAIQASLATLIASAIGYSLSEQRWYWASITAFIIFTGSSRGENLMRAIFRVVGTVAGLAIGFLMAYLIKGQTNLEWTLILISIFIGLYSSRLSFGFFTATAFTLMLAFLFDIMGMLTSEILILRLEETAIGAIVGGFVALYVLSTRTTSLVRETLSLLLKKMRDVIDLLPLEVKDGSKKELVKRLREMDQTLLNLRNATLPLINKFNFTSDQRIKDLLFYSIALSYYIRQIATMKRKEEDDIKEIIHRCEKLKKNLLSDETKSQAKENLPQNNIQDDISHVFSRADFFISEINSLL